MDMETARELLDAIRLAEAAAPDNDVFIPVELVPRIRAVGDVPFFLSLLRTYEDSSLWSEFVMLSIYWKDVPYEVWRQVLREVAADPIVMYQLTWTYGQFLGIDVKAMIASDPVASAAVRDPGGISGEVGEWFLTMCELYEIDYIATWRRLAAEGAPMRHDLDTLPPVPSTGYKQWLYSED